MDKQTQEGFKNLDLTTSAANLVTDQAEFSEKKQKIKGAGKNKK